MAAPGTKNLSLKYNADGSLTLSFQHNSPGLDGEANWVPAPTDEFSLYIRTYWPKQSVLDGTWVSAQCSTGAIALDETSRMSGFGPSRHIALPCGLSRYRGRADIAFVAPPRWVYTA